MEKAVKELVRHRLPLVKTPDAVRASVIRCLAHESEPLPRDSWSSAAGRFSSCVVPVGVAVLIAASFFLFVQFRGGIRKGSVLERDIVNHALDQHHMLESRLSPTIARKAPPPNLRGAPEVIMSSGVNGPVETCSLVASVDDDMGGVRHSHLGYQYGPKVVSYFALPFDDVLHGKCFSLPPDALVELKRTGWYNQVQADGRSIVFWRQGPQLCVAVAHMSGSDLHSLLAVTPEKSESSATGW